MRIKQLEINGFKSFADRTVIEMHGGLTAIVGPNGCGKSNVVDAIRWVLGEQSAKNLRGGSMEDVIFNGTEKKKQKGMAEVSIVLTGVSRELPTGMAVDEVRVTRRLFRSGESEYLINGNPCRLRDIRDIFLDTGLELKSYAILEQGKVGEIINSKATDRRFLIEEAAGVVKYKVRKQEAISKLESAQTNLQRIRDIIAEVKRQMNALDRLARKAEQFKVLQEESKGLELGLSRREFDELTEGLAASGTRLEELRLAESEAVARLERINTDAEQRKLALAEEQTAMEQAQLEIYEFEKQAKDLEGRIQLLQSERKNLEERCARNATRQDETQARETAMSAEVEALVRQEEALRGEVEEFKARYKENMDLAQGCETELLDFEVALEAKRKELFARTDEVAHARNDVSNLNREKENQIRNGNRAASEIENLGREVEAAQARLTRSSESAAALAAKVTEISDRREATRSDLEARREALHKAQAEHREAKDRFVSADSRLRSLIEMDKSLVGYGEGVKKLIQGRDTDHDLRIQSLIAETIEVAKDHEAAIEALLGERLQSLIMDDHAEARRALGYLREKGHGRGVFMPAGARPLREPDLPTGEGIIGRAADLVRARSGHEGRQGLIRNLLSSAVVVRDMDTALGHWATSELTFVTLAGEVLEPSGLILGGSERGLLSMKREIRELETEVEAARARTERCEIEIREISEAVAGLESALMGFDHELRDVERQLADVRREEAMATTAWQQISQRLDFMNAEQRQAIEEVQKLERLALEKSEQLRATEEARATVEAGIAEIQNGLQEKRKELDRLRNDAAERRVEYQTRKSRLEAMVSEKDRLGQLLAEARQGLEQLRHQRVHMEADMARVDQESTAKAEELAGLMVRIKEASDSLASRKAAYNEAFLELRAIEEEVRKIRPDVDHLRQQRGALELQKAQFELRLENLNRNIFNTYGLELASVEPAEVPEGAAERLRELREKIAAMGPISLGSLEEHRELSERYEFLLKQQEDLNQSISSLQEAISKINRTTKDRLREAYDRLREEFQKVFKTLFGGGRADLLLVGEESILEAGIDIVAQPPGKKIQNITQLSGGEKALTAISILFAGFLIKPSPLCVLDEVDAPLDESNTDRFGNLLKVMSENTQFLTITHNKRTMEEAHMIYGVTMEEAGVSKIISVRMSDYVEA